MVIALSAVVGVRRLAFLFGRLLRDIATADYNKSLVSTTTRLRIALFGAKFLKRYCCVVFRHSTAHFQSALFSRVAGMSVKDRKN